MKLSQQLYNDFLKEIDQQFKTIPVAEAFNYKKYRTYTMSYDYLIDLMAKVKELEEALRLNEVPPLQEMQIE